MTEIKVTTSRSYNVKIQSGLLERAGEEIKEYCKNGVCTVVTDDKVSALYYERLERSLKNAGICAVQFVFPNGEASKNAETYLALLNFLAEKQMTRSDPIVALGGGVVGDLSGFAAASYLRGVPFIQIPTTLLAMVDSSVGGKTAIDLPAGKNLAGAFYQPHLVLCDIDLLDTLSPNVFADGCAEVIKYAVLNDAALFDDLLQKGVDFDRETVIAACVSMKRDIVERDEFDGGCRQFLNLGHTIGHAIEKCSLFRVTHGAAVATGMYLLAKYAAENGLCDKQTPQKIQEMLQKFSLPTQTEFPMQVLLQAMTADKKRNGASLTLVLPTEIGKCRLYDIELSKLPSFFGI